MRGSTKYMKSGGAVAKNKTAKYMKSGGAVESKAKKKESGMTVAQARSFLKDKGYKVVKT